MSPRDRAILEGLMRKLPESSRDRLLLLSQRWKISDLFAGQLAATTRRLRAQIADTHLDETTRLSAAKNLVRLDDETATARAVLDQITLQTTPVLARGFIGALGESRNADTGRELITHWARLTPAQRKVGIVTLLRRAEWSEALLKAIEMNQVLPTELGPENWQQLRNSPDRSIAARARELANAGRPISADRESVVKKLMPVAKQMGDAARGKEIFATTCAVCHKFDGQGASVGPELTGVGARPREDILVDILDPNRSVEANYRLWNVTTKSGETISGRLDAETQTSIELYDLAGQKHAVQRKDIASLEASNLSIMPVGFEALPESDLASLLEYLTQPPPKTAGR